MQFTFRQNNKLLHGLQFKFNYNVYSVVCIEKGIYAIIGIPEKASGVDPRPIEECYIYKVEGNNHPFIEDIPITDNDGGWKSFEYFVEERSIRTNFMVKKIRQEPIELSDLPTGTLVFSEDRSEHWLIIQHLDDDMDPETYAIPVECFEEPNAIHSQGDFPVGPRDMMTNYSLPEDYYINSIKVMQTHRS